MTDQHEATLTLTHAETGRVVALLRQERGRFELRRRQQERNRDAATHGHRTQDQHWGALIEGTADAIRVLDGVLALIAGFPEERRRVTSQSWTVEEILAREG